MEHKTSPAVMWFWIIVGIMLIGAIVGSGDSSATSDSDTYEAPTCYYMESYDASICSDGTTR